MSQVISFVGRTREASLDAQADCAAVIERLAKTLSETPGAVQAFVSVTCSGKDATEVEQLAALKALQVPLIWGVGA